MKGIDLSREYFYKHGLPVLEADFSDLLPYLAAGILGSGSECFGYDDDISADHDLEPGFCLMLPGEDIISRSDAFRLERAYSKLPKEFKGFKRSLTVPVGGVRKGILRISDLFIEKTGTPDGVLSAVQWLSVPEASLAEAVNGEVFFDNFGLLTDIRNRLYHYPEDIRLKRLASNLLIMGQSGQYNYRRCLAHKEPASAQLAVYEYVKSAVSVIFLLNRKFQPYYKWCFRALRELPRLSLNASLLEYLMTTDNDGSQPDAKSDIIENIAADIIDELKMQNITKAVCMDLEKHAYSVNDMISDPEIRNMHILAAV